MRFFALLALLFSLSCGSSCSRSAMQPVVIEPAKPFTIGDEINRTSTAVVAALEEVEARDDRLSLQEQRAALIARIATVWVIGIKAYAELSEEDQVYVKALVDRILQIPSDAAEPEAPTAPPAPLKLRATR